MNWQRLRQILLAKHPGEPQKASRIEHALREAEAALNALTSLGYRYHLADGPGPEYPEWPRRLFHIDSAPNGRTVNSEAEAEELGDGWYGTLEEAQFSDGMDTQFMGRGGVNRKGLPSVLGAMSLEQLAAEAAAAERYKTTVIAEFKSRKKKPANGAGTTGESNAIQ